MTDIIYMEENNTDSKPSPKFAQLGGTQNTELTLAPNQDDEYITFDFMVNLSSEHLEPDSLKTAIKESVDCNIDQIQELKIKQIDDGKQNKTSRIKGKIFTDDWELPMLQKKFQKIISQRVLSGQLQNHCNLEDRPMIRRFFCKTSKQQKPNSLENLATTDSLRTLKDDGIKAKQPKHIATTPKLANGHKNEGSDTPNSKTALNSDEISGSSSSSNSSSKSEGTKLNKTTNSVDIKNNEPCECFCVIL